MTEAERTLYRRPLPAEAIAFSSVAGRQLFAEALASGGLDGYFPLAEQFHTQSEPAYCGLGSLVVALNALAIDPGRLWKGPWRWFGEELLDCCVPLAVVRERGIALDELACLARCNGAEVTVARAEADDLSGWREALGRAARGEGVLIASYDRAAIGQSGGGHFSPIGGYHAKRDLVLVLDVARFKYPPHWVSAERLWDAMRGVDPSTGRARGWMLLRPRGEGVALGFSVRCDGASWHDLPGRVAAAAAAAGDAATIGTLAAALGPLAGHLQVRVPTATAHQEALAAARAALRELPLQREVQAAVPADAAEAVAMLLLAGSGLLLPAQRTLVTAAAGALAKDDPLALELANVRAQISALGEHAAGLSRDAARLGTCGGARVGGGT
ncbi:MAG: hypothetical protein JWP97_2820 [Labilithrix sp.]|nr:hypothetical protein [Labilithrix sp.]